MKWTTIVSVADLANSLHNTNLRIIDCRFNLEDTSFGSTAYKESHIPEAIYAHIDDDLSGKVIDGVTGRHPLPSVADCVKLFSLWGIDNNTQVVVYDDSSGVFAGRLWWMLRWLGHNNVAVVDGGWKHWLQEKHPTSSEIPQLKKTDFQENLQPQMQVSVDDVMAMLQDKHIGLFDARSEERYLAKPNSLDSVSGHIPRARSAFFGNNLDQQGLFLPADQLNHNYKNLLQGMAPSETVFYCGSGVSVHHNLLAMEIAGLANNKEDNARVFIGSWSQWIADPLRPIE